MIKKLQGLYELGEKLKELKWWNFCEMDGSVVIKNPENNVMGYCVFLGNNTEIPEINIYVGEEGIGSYLDLEETINLGYVAHSAEFIKSYYRQKALNFTIVQGEPNFACFSPGEFPQEIESENDIEFLLMILNQLLKILLQIKAGNLRFIKGKWINAFQENGSWKYEYVSHEELVKHRGLSPYHCNYRNDLKVHRLKKLKKIPTTLEGVQFFVPPQVWDHELKRELIPIVTTFVDQKLGFICLNDLSGHKKSNLEKISDKLADIFLKQSYVPQKIMVEDTILKDLIEDFCKQLGIECQCGTPKLAKKVRDTLLN